MLTKLVTQKIPTFFEIIKVDILKFGNSSFVFFVNTDGNVCNWCWLPHVTFSPLPDANDRCEIIITPQRIECLRQLAFHLQIFKMSQTWTLVLVFPKTIQNNLAISKYDSKQSFIINSIAYLVEIVLQSRKCVFLKLQILCQQFIRSFIHKILNCSFEQPQF